MLHSMRATFPNHHLWNNRDRHVTSDIVLQLRPWYSDTHDLHEKDVKDGTAKCHCYFDESKTIVYTCFIVYSHGCLYAYSAARLI